MAKRALISLAARLARAAGGLALSLALSLAVSMVVAPQARAEYRAYELEVADLHECRMKKLEKCKTWVVQTSMAPDLYQRTHGGVYRIGVVLLATWMCYGDTSDFKAVCPRPQPVNPKYQPGQKVKVKLKKHVTEGWRGDVEVSYYQRDIRSNVYGVRFPDRRMVYARYYEKDLESAEPPAPRDEPPP
ncbi:MAG: hypothetical protein OEV94_01600 [Deltaproteobacteria bacterium]|nr:hypothetical protein [Deltaproteobacteria bacterium]